MRILMIALTLPPLTACSNIDGTSSHTYVTPSAQDAATRRYASFDCEGDELRAAASSLRVPETGRTTSYPEALCDLGYDPDRMAPRFVRIESCLLLFTAGTQACLPPTLPASPKLGADSLARCRNAVGDAALQVYSYDQIAATADARYCTS